MIVAAVLAAASAYKTLIAVGVVEQGSLPGEGAPGGVAIGVTVAAAILVGTALAFVLAGIGERATALAAVLAPAAAAFLLAHYYTFDPYYLPSLRRYSTGLAPPEFVFVLIGLACLAGLVTWRTRRPGLLLSAPLLLLCGLTAWFAGLGH